MTNGHRDGHWATACVIATLAISLAVRLAGLGYGLPAVYNPDEVAIMNRALGLSQSGFNPHNFLYPTLYFYALFAWEGCWFVLGRVTGVFDSLAAFERAFFVDPSTIYLAGRTLSVACGVLTVWVTIRLGTRLFGRVAGLAAGAILALAPLAVRDAHYVKHDVPVTLLIALAHLALTYAVERPRAIWWWVTTAALGGLAMSTHYYAIFVAVPITVLALWPGRNDEPWSARTRRLAVAGAATTLAFFAGSPFLLVEPATALRDVVANRAIVVDRLTENTGAFGALPFYLTWLARDAAGVVAALLALLGFFSTKRNGWTPVTLVLSFPVAFLLFIANTFPASRYLNPLLPFIALLAGLGVSVLTGSSGARRVVGLAVLAAALVEAGSVSIRGDLFFRQADTRTLALTWMEQHVPADTSVLVQPYSVPLRPSKAALVEALTVHLGSPAAASVRFQRQLSLDPYPAPAYRTIFLGVGGLDVDKIYVAPMDFATGSLDVMRRMAVTHVVLKRYNAPDPSMDGLVTSLTTSGHLLASFSPYGPGTGGTHGPLPAPFLHNTDARIVAGLERPGPIVEIWSIK